MATEPLRRPAAAITLAAAPLLWPALWNGYPLVFADTGTYLSQAIEHYVGWDRPIFYSLFMLPLHMTLSTWPVILAQALLVSYTLHLVQRVLAPDSSVWWLIPMTALLSAITSLPWFASQLMPDVFTPLLVLALTLLVLAPDRLTRCERTWLVLFGAFMIAAHQSHVLLAALMLLVLLPRRRWLGAEAPLGWAGLLRTVLPLLLALIALSSVNLIAFRRASPSPFGATFLLARVIYDGPGMRELQRDCPRENWRLCPYLGAFPATSDDFLWRGDSPLARAGGAKLVSADANAIIIRALWAEPAAELRALLANTAEQLRRFASADGLQAWPNTVTPWLQREFPIVEFAAYNASRQSQGRLALPDWLHTLHLVLATGGIITCCVWLWIAPGRLTTGFAVAVLIALLANALITGGLSTPHDRYQARIAWLPLFIVLLGIARSLPYHSQRPARFAGP